MDKLSEVPLNNTEITDKEKEILHKYFSEDKDSPGSENNCISSWKHIVYIAIAFLILSNPWIDFFLTKIPYCPDNKLLLLVLKTSIFIILLVLIQKYF